MHLRVTSLILRAAILAGVATVPGANAYAQVRIDLFDTFPATAPDPNLPFPGGNVICSATAAGSSSGFSFNFDNAATRALLCPANPDRISPSNSFGARITGALVAPTTGTYSLTLNADDGNRLSINGVVVRTDWVVKGGGPGLIGNIDLLAGANPFVFDYFQGPPVAAFAELTVTNLTVAPPAPPQVIPEPATVTLVGVGALALGFGARRRRV